MEDWDHYEMEQQDDDVSSDESDEDSSDSDGMSDRDE